MKDCEDSDGERQHESPGGEMSSGNSDNPPQCNRNRNKETDCSSPACGDKQGMRHEDHYPGFHCCTGCFVFMIAGLVFLSLFSPSIPTNISSVVGTRLPVKPSFGLSVCWCVTF
jgi:hypothetical protein